jgi:hypothetical protein
VLVVPVDLLLSDTGSPPADTPKRFSFLENGMNSSLAELAFPVVASNIERQRGRLIRPDYDACTRSILSAIEAVGGDAEYADITDRTPHDSASVKACMRDLVSYGAVIVIRNAHGTPNSYLLPHMIEV